MNLIKIKFYSTVLAFKSLQILKAFEDLNQSEWDCCTSVVILRAHVKIRNRNLCFKKMSSQYWFLYEIKAISILSLGRLFDGVKIAFAFFRLQHFMPFQDLTCGRKYSNLIFFSFTERAVKNCNPDSYIAYLKEPSKSQLCKFDSRRQFSRPHELVNFLDVLFSSDEDTIKVDHLTKPVRYDSGKLKKKSRVQVVEDQKELWSLLQGFSGSKFNGVFVKMPRTNRWGRGKASEVIWEPQRRSENWRRNTHKPINRIT